MDKEILIEENNRKRKLLTKENEKYYDDMLIYIRLSFAKSEQKTEEVLMELLDHLLEAQEEGRRAEDVFGDHPKQYVQEITGELPTMVTKERTGSLLMIMLYFLASVAFFDGVFGTGIYFIFDQGEFMQTYHLGSLIVKTVLNVSAAFLLLYGAMFLLQWLSFKHVGKVWEFILSWLYGVASFGIFLAVVWLVPTFGPVFEVPVYSTIVIGIVLFIAGRIVRKRI